MRTHLPGCFCVSAESARVASALAYARSRAKPSGLAPRKASAPTPKLQRALGQPQLRDRRKNRTLKTDPSQLSARGCGTRKNNFVKREKRIGEIPRLTLFARDERVWREKRIGESSL